ncbi:hypothetical protein R1flu_007689 [Riccia fluitans]|uniref:Uncharacterized protein n=1 Tax=Riccia fluitans TaxID=41844 RepID=A0ABD1YZU9_9MARC
MAGAGPYSGNSTLALVARVTAVTLGVAYGSRKLYVVKPSEPSATDIDCKIKFYLRALQIIPGIKEELPMHDYDVELVFQRDAYYVPVRETEGNTLTIEVERKNDGCRWRGDFTSRYIEEITHRAGNLKSFKVFVEMLKAAFHRKSTALLVDLLTYQDLEKLVVTRGTDDSYSTPSCRRALSTEKRYLILTYVAEFDRVHYPLPLIYEEDADPRSLETMHTAAEERDRAHESSSTL